MRDEGTSLDTQALPGLALQRARRMSDRLFEQVRPEAWLDRPIPERNRLLFYLGHLEAFDWNQLASAAGHEDSASSLDTLFAFGIDPPPGMLPQDRPEDWPALDRVAAYVRSTRRRVDEAISAHPELALDIAVEHRLMHVETLTYMLHALPYERRLVQPAPPEPARPSPNRQRIEIPDGQATLGKARSDGFGWDNEFESYTTRVERFAVDRYKITNGQYLAFVDAGGEPPPFWKEGREGWLWRGYDGEIPLPLDRPVYVTWDQACAFAKWTGGELPSEAQFHRYAFGTPQGPERAYPWGEMEPSRERGNFDFFHRDTISVAADPAGDSAFGVAQAVGNGWEWTRSAFAPFPGFAALPSYPGYSAAFFDAQHYVLKGASCATDRTLLRRSFRNWFRPHYRHAYTTFRLVEN